jgi:hypothetical protein
LGQVAIYCRVSTDDQSCERQERDLRAFAKRAGHKVVAVFKETGSGADNGRPERAKVLVLARAHKVDAILVTELSRWGRSTQDLVQTLDDLHGWKVSVLAQTGLSFDLSTASGKLMRTIMAGLARVRARSDQGTREVGVSIGQGPWRQTRPATGPAPVGQEGQEGARHACGRSVLSTHCPQRRSEPEHGDEHCQAERRAMTRGDWPCLQERRGLCSRAAEGW